jgi:hypothetical protein
MIVWHTHPYVSGLLCLTEPSRLVLAQKAVDCFVQQNWAHRELVVLNATGQALPRLKHPGCGLRTVSLLPKSDLLQLAGSLAEGEWCVTWRDDCWFEPDYIRAVMDAADKRHVVVASPISVYSLTEQRRQDARTDLLSCWFRLGPRASEQRHVSAAHLVLKFIR